MRVPGESKSISSFWAVPAPACQCCLNIQQSLCISNANWRMAPMFAHSNVELRPVWIDCEPAVPCTCNFWTWQVYHSLPEDAKLLAPIKESLGRDVASQQTRTDCTRFEGAHIASSYLVALSAKKQRHTESTPRDWIIANRSLVSHWRMNSAHRLTGTRSALKLSIVLADQYELRVCSGMEASSKWPTSRDRSWREKVSNCELRKGLLL